MGKVATLRTRVATMAPRVATANPDRQAHRTHATNSTTWRRIRDEVLARDLYTCQKCRRLVGRKGEAHVDHRDGDATNNDPDNLQTLCAPCHSHKTATEDGGFGAPRRT